jgi:hypothetical protein
MHAIILPDWHLFALPPKKIFTPKLSLKIELLLCHFQAKNKSEWESTTKQYMLKMLAICLQSSFILLLSLPYVFLRNQMQEHGILF